MSDSNATKNASGPLVGLKVIDLGMLFAGPLVASQLADLGADVIKIEPPKGEEVRKIGRFKNGEGLWWRVVGRNKRLVTADISKPAGAEIVRRLARTADVVIENFRPGRMREWELDYDTLSAENRGLVMLHISGYGQDGPYSDRPGMGTLAEAFSGFAHVTGEADGPPTLPPFPFADGVAAMSGTYAVLAALYARDRNGGYGDEIDLSLYEPLLSLMGAMVVDYDQLGVIMKRKGNRSTWTVPRNAYRTTDDRWVTLSCAANSIAQRLFRAIGRDDMADDPGLATNPLRLKRLEECDSVIAKWISEHTLDETLQRFHDFDVVAGPIYDVAQICADPHVKHRKTVIEVEDPVLGSVRVQNVVPRFQRSPGRIRWVGKPEVGSDTRIVLAELGYSSDDIARLESDGIISPASNKTVSSAT